MEDLSLLLQSRYPILYVETYDEERLRERLAQSARSIGFSFYTWSVSGGLICEGARPSSPDACEPLAVLAAIRGIAWPAIVLLQDFHPYLQIPAVVRALRELAEESPGRWKTLVLSAPSIDLPQELRRVAARYRLEWPDSDEIRATIIETFRSLRGTRPLRFDLPGEQLDRMVQALRGLTLAEIRRLVARATLHDGVLHAQDLPLILAARREEIEQTGVLDLCEVGGEIADLAGCARLKDWLRVHHAGFGAKARELGLPAPRGLLLVGVQGCGKSLTAKTIARSWGLPLARLDPSRLFDKFVGETEKNFRRALETTEAQAPIVLWIDEIEKAFAPGDGEADAGLGRRLFGSFLTWLQEHREPVFVVATANDLDSLGSGCRPLRPLGRERRPPDHGRLERRSGSHFAAFADSGRGAGRVTGAGPGTVRPGTVRVGAQHAAPLLPEFERPGLQDQAVGVGAAVVLLQPCDLIFAEEEA